MPVVFQQLNNFVSMIRCISLYHGYQIIFHLNDTGIEYEIINYNYSGRNTKTDGDSNFTLSKFFFCLLLSRHDAVEGIDAQFFAFSGHEFD